MIENTLNKLRFTWENFTEREKWISASLGVILVVFLFTFPLFLMIRTNATLQEDNQALQRLLENIVSQRDRLELATREKRLADRRYEQKTPPLGGFLETLAKDQGLTIHEVTDQPEKAFGKFVRRSVQISISNIALTPLINLLSAIETSRYPVAIDQIQVDHYRAGDSYNIRLGVVTYDKEGARPSKAIRSTSDERKDSNLLDQKTKKDMP